jgi:hypothetical protein
MSDQPPPDPAADMRARAQELARLLLEAMDTPTSPEREAYLARKEREDREGLEHFYRLTGQCKATVAEAVNALAYALQTLPPDGPFDERKVEVEGLCGRKAILSLEPSARNTPFMRSIVLTVFTPSGLSTSSVWLAHGTNADLAAFLQRESLVTEIGAAAEERVISLERHRLA